VGRLRSANDDLQGKQKKENEKMSDFNFTAERMIDHDKRLTAEAVSIALGAALTQITDEKSRAVLQRLIEAVTPASGQAEVVRCLVTGNPVGTDIWLAGSPCRCANCKQAEAKETKP
jgi:hypothetical protein